MGAKKVLSVLKDGYGVALVLSGHAPVGTEWDQGFTFDPDKLECVKYLPGSFNQVPSAS